MLLRSLTKHVKDQNWFAVALDFFIVVAGILIAFQITNWNDGQRAKVSETALLLQLEEEFTEIKSQLEKQITVRAEWVQNIGVLISKLEGSTSDADELEIKTALDNATATGRRPAQSAAYLQLMANGGLTALSNDGLQQALVGYDVRLQRDAFIHPELMKLIVVEMSTNKFVDYNMLSVERSVAAIDESEDPDPTRNMIRSYDLDGLHEYENRYETMYVLHSLLLAADEVQLDLALDVLNQISGETQ